MQKLLISFLILIICICLGLLLGNLGALALSYLMDKDLSIVLYIEAQCSPEERIFLRGVNFLNHLFTFTIAPLVATYYVYRKGFLNELGLTQKSYLRHFILGLVYIAFSFPLAQLLYSINQEIPLPDWAFQAERDTEKLLYCILQMDSPLELLSNILVIAVLPAFGEEVLFRGFIQKRLSNHLSAWWAITITAFLFSAVHFQFEGFLARFLLGGILGYLFYKTNNLWVPIVTHLFFNGLQVLAFYFLGEQAIDQDLPDTTSLLLPGLISLLVLVLIGYFWKKNTTHVH